MDRPLMPYVSSAIPSNGQAIDAATSSTTTTNMNNTAGNNDVCSTIAIQPMLHTSQCQQPGGRPSFRLEPPISVVSEQPSTWPKRRRLHTAAPTCDFPTQQTTSAKRKPEDAMPTSDGPTISQSHTVFILRSKKPRVDMASTAAARGELLIGPRLSARFKSQRCVLAVTPGVC